MQPPNPGYWSISVDGLLAALGSDAHGLDPEESARRLERIGPNVLRAAPALSWIRVALRQVGNPLVLILLFAALVSAIVHDWLDAAIVLAIVAMSVALSVVQEYRASAAVAALRARTSARARVRRPGGVESIPAARIVAGDIVELAAGSLVPADGVLLEAKDLYVNEAVLTGETFPTEKRCGEVARDATVAQRRNCVFMGTSVRSGLGVALVVATGRATEYGHIAERLLRPPPRAEFETGLRRFGLLLIRVILVLVLAVFALNVYLDRPFIDSLLFSVAIAVGLSPELLPAILNVTLARGARAMARDGVIVRRLDAIEDLGSMDVLCTDKTGTLTEGTVRLDEAVDLDGAPSPGVLLHAALNASLQTGLASPLDEAIVTAARESALDLARWSKLDEVPYDFVRKRMSVIARGPPPTGAVLIAKGALEPLLEACTNALVAGSLVPIAGKRDAILARHAAWSEAGLRVLGVAVRSVDAAGRFSREAESGLTLLGFLVFSDPPKPGVGEVLNALRALGVSVKLITGDNARVATHLARQLAIPDPRVLTGAELDRMREEALWHVAEHTDLFAEVDPNQKERIILALRRTGHVVGYLGDGINDAPPLHAADVGISVDQAVDVAKESADIVLLERDLDVLRQGIEQGRRTFANTLKYIFITTSANFGNMVSMAIASAALPFLPLLAKQILLNNFLSDLPAMTLATDRVDQEWVDKPRRWDVHVIRRVMIVFGVVSSAFDVLTFVVLWRITRGDADLFRTGWFVESLLTELLILLVLRTARPCLRSRGSRALVGSVLAVTILTLCLPYLPGSDYLALYPLGATVIGSMLAITFAYLAATELIKRRWFRPF